MCPQVDGELAAREILLPLDRSTAASLRMGEKVLLTGLMYTARDAAHKKLIELLDAKKPLPIALRDQVIYYCGPCPAPDGFAIGSAGPTTSGRMDRYTPQLLAGGLRGMVGKGARSAAVVEAMREYIAVYFGATGGAGALLARHIVASEVIAFHELGPEAIRQIHVERFPVTVVIDSLGDCLYDHGRRAYSKR